MKQRGILYGVGVGPGDPELMTLKAVRIIEKSDVIVVPGKKPEDSVAYKIAAGVCEDLAHKRLAAVEMPMVKDENLLKAVHLAAARQIEALLDENLTVSFLTLGDVTIYATYMYIHTIVEADGYDTEIINGITSFTAAAARLNIDLVKKDEPLHVIPASYRKDSVAELLKLPGTKILMKSGKEMANIRDAVLAGAYNAIMVENCGMPGEKIYRDAAEIPDDASYYSVIIIKEKQEEEE